MADDLSCAVCFRSFSECVPIFFACGHSLGEECAEKLPKQTPPGIECPHCREITKLGPKGIAGLPRNWAARNAAVQLEVSQRTVTEEARRECENCSTAAATVCCGMCGRSVFCDSCFKDVHSPPIMKKHVAVPVDSMTAPDPICPKHGEKQRVYCSQCNIGVCTFCVVTTHKDHPLKEVSEIAVEIRKKLVDCAARAHAYKDGAIVAALEAKDAIPLIEQGARESEELVTLYASDLKEAVDARVKVLLVQITELRDQKTKQLKEHIRQLEAAASMATHEATLAESCNLKAEADDIMRCGAIVGRVEAMVRFGLGERPRIPPVVAATLSPELLTRVREFGTINGGNVPSPPGAPVLVSATEDTITIRWDAPAENATPDTDYDVYCELLGEEGAVKTAPVVLPVVRVRRLETQITALDQNSQYRFQVRASNGNWTDGDPSPWSVAMRPRLPAPTAVMRYTGQSTGWGYGGSIDGVVFQTDRDIDLVGYGLYGGPGAGRFTAHIGVGTGGNTLEDHELVWHETAYDTGAGTIAQVMFPAPVRIRARQNYVATVRVQGGNSVYGQTGQNTVTQDEVTFTFSRHQQGGNDNGTSVEQGQIPQLLFRRV